MTTPDNSATEKPTIAERLRSHLPADCEKWNSANRNTFSTCKPIPIADVYDAAAELDRLHSANEKLRGLFRELLDIAECDANTEENADVILRAQAAARAAEGGE